MTFSIIAHDVATGQVGIAVASKTLATGARVPHIRTGVGAIASQARVNHYYGPRGLALLAAVLRPPIPCACSSPPTRIRTSVRSTSWTASDGSPPTRAPSAWSGAAIW